MSTGSNRRFTSLDGRNNGSRGTYRARAGTGIPGSAPALGDDEGVSACGQTVQPADEPVARASPSSNARRSAGPSTGPSPTTPAAGSP